MQAFTKLSSIFVIPFAGVSLFMASLGVLHGIYAKYFGISLTAIATVLLVSRLFDAINDPIIGYSSDRVRLHTGTRKQFVFIGGLLTAISCYFLIQPPGRCRFSPLHRLEPDALSGHNAFRYSLYRLGQRTGP